MGVNSLFISYSHQDMKPTHWLDRLKLYLAPLRRQEIVDFWDDTRIQAGSDWRSEIRAAMEHATAAILLVGPGFLASEFITGQELPILLAAAKSRGTKIYPLIVGYCGYKRSVLEPYQSFNGPEMPLEALPTAEQNKILNEISLAVDQDMRQLQELTRPKHDLAKDTRSALKEIAKNLDSTLIAYRAQCTRRNELYRMISERLEIKTNLQYENFFFPLLW
jgi:hypothetical protein